MNAIKFKELYIGTADGETEAQNEHFEELFYDPNNKYEELFNNGKFIITGSKGSGKTYLAHYVCKKAKSNQRRVIVNAQDFWIDKLMNNVEDIQDRGVLYSLCKWFLLDKIAKELIKERRIISKYYFWSKIYKLRKFVNNYEDSDFFKKIKIISEATNGSAKEVSAQESYNKQFKKWNRKGKYSRTIGKANTTEEIRKEFYELIRAYEVNISNCISKKEDMMLLIDDLDEIDKRASDNSIISILIKIAKDYNIKFNNNKKGVKIVLLIRSDIINALQKFDPNLSKIKTSCAVELYWLVNPKTKPENQPLISMVLHKIKACCIEYKNYSNENLYKILFPEKVDAKLPSEYLLDYSFGRPRDIITYLNHAIDNNPDATYFSATMLKEVRKLYSSDFYDEMLNAANYDGNSEYAEECLRLISGMKKVSFYYGEIEIYYRDNKKQYQQVQNLDEALSYLYKIGAIGNSWMTGGKPHTSWSYKKDAMNTLDLGKKFTIHFALRKKFSL